MGIVFVCGEVGKTDGLGVGFGKRAKDTLLAFEKAVLFLGKRD